MQQCLYFLMMTSASLITDATMFIFFYDGFSLSLYFNDNFSLTNNVYIFNDGFSLTTTVGLAVCLAAIIFTLDSVFKLVSFRQHSLDKELLFY